MRFNFLLLIKAYNAYDFIYWLRYHGSRFQSSQFTVIDNDSKIDVEKILADEVPGRWSCMHVEGFPNQTELYSRLLSETPNPWFELGDAVITIDDDEYLYFTLYREEDVRRRYDEMYSSALYNMLTKYEALAIPEVFISQREVSDKRDTYLPMPLTHKWVRDPQAHPDSQCKFVLYWRPGHKYEFPVGEGGLWHFPVIDSEKCRAAVGEAWVDEAEKIYTQTWNIDSAFAKVNLSSHLLLYHYHIKSRWDWDEKLKRGSCFSKRPWYSKKLEENMFYGGYEVEHEKMAREFSRWVPDSKIEKKPEPIEPEKSDPPVLEDTSYERIKQTRLFKGRLKEGKSWIKSAMPNHDWKRYDLATLINTEKLTNFDPRKTIWSDKIRTYAELWNANLAGFRIPMLAYKYQPTDSELRELIDLASKHDCILKCNHGSGWNLSFKAYEKINRDYIYDTVRRWLSLNFAYISGYEWNYEAIVPGVLIQRDLFANSEHLPIDYQFYCVNGKVEVIDLHIKSGKSQIVHLACTDGDGGILPWSIGDWAISKSLDEDQMKIVEDMMPVVDYISSMFPFVRVDMLWNGHPFFEEATFVPCGGVIDLPGNPKIFKSN